MHWAGFFFVLVVMILRHPSLLGVGFGLVAGYSIMFFFYKMLGGQEGPLR